MRVRLILAAVVVVGASLCGRAAAGAARQRTVALRLLLEDIRVLRVQMVSMFEPVQFSLSRARSPLLAQVGRGMSEGKSAGEAWEKLRQGRSALAPEDREALDLLFRELGETGRERQELLLSGTAERLRQLLEGAAEQARRADQLYGALGLLLGLLMALVVI